MIVGPQHISQKKYSRRKKNPVEMDGEIGGSRVEKMAVKTPQNRACNSEQFIYM